MKSKVFIKKGDLILIVVILIVCSVFLIPKYLDKSPVTAVVYKDGAEVDRIDLSKVTETYDLDLESSPDAVLTVSNNCICYSKADCHDKLCIRTGKLSNPGDTAACLPSKTLVVIEGQKKDDSPDVITY